MSEFKVGDKFMIREGNVDKHGEVHCFEVKEYGFGPFTVASLRDDSKGVYFNTPDDDEGDGGWTMPFDCITKVKEEAS